MEISLIENEPERLAALLKHHVLDTEIKFEDITLIASHICETPIALVTLMDKEDAYFKSTIGLSLTKAPRQDVFCNHTIHQHEVFIIEDTLKDERFAGNRFVSNDPHIRFYAGASLIDKEGYALGTVCVMDFKPRILSEGQIKALKALSRQIIRLIELHDYQDKINENMETMIQSARLSSLGEMANGVAHEVNNPLSVIDHAIEKMNRSHKFDPASISIIQNAINKITNIISGLRSYARSGEEDPKEKIHVNTLLQNTLDFFASRAKEDNVYLELKTDPNHVVEAKQAQVSQILMNLMQNAFEAAHEAEIKWISLKSYEEDDSVVIEVSDSGPGIDKSLSERIFEPFYTTRNSKDSIGMGLSVSKNLAEKNGGSLYLDPTSTETKFVLKLKKDTKTSSLEHWPQLPDRPLLVS